MVRWRLNFPHWVKIDTVLLALGGVNLALWYLYQDYHSSKQPPWGQSDYLNSKRSQYLKHQSSYIVRLSLHNDQMLAGSVIASVIFHLNIWCWTKDWPDDNILTSVTGIQRIPQQRCKVSPDIFACLSNLSNLTDLQVRFEKSFGATAVAYEATPGVYFDHWGQISQS